MRGPRARALSTHLPVTTTSAPSSRARAIGAALLEKKQQQQQQHQQYNSQEKRNKEFITFQAAVMAQFSFQEKFQPHWQGSLLPLEIESNTLLLKEKILAFCWLQF